MLAVQQSQICPLAWSRGRERGGGGLQISFWFSGQSDVFSIQWRGDKNGIIPRVAVDDQKVLTLHILTLPFLSPNTWQIYSYSWFNHVQSTNTFIYSDVLCLFCFKQKAAISAHLSLLLLIWKSFFMMKPYLSSDLVISAILVLHMLRWISLEQSGLGSRPLASKFGPSTIT